MKKCLFTLAALMLFTGIAQAECQLSLSRNEINYGKVHESDYSGQHKRWKTLNSREVQLNVVCDAPVKMAVFAHGGAQDEGFRFASDSVMLISASNATLDGKRVALGKTTSHSPFILNGTGSDKKLLRDNDGLMPVSANQIMEGQQFSVTLTVRPALSEHDTTVKDKSKLESDLNFNVETES
ncbi:hypothetical protein QL200_11080 [Cronobacter dublinensis]|uniref:hypothetical protein n=1 Tax=Cronobacter dublinensis TaxID=413497 RepID=UPI001F3C9D72|nr:hypothetical protein [Cronobacter dublinensis]MDI6426472.1 hypothetical protein [Cronobacter dublinensis]